MKSREIQRLPSIVLISCSRTSRKKVFVANCFSLGITPSHKRTIEAARLRIASQAPCPASLRFWGEKPVSPCSNPRWHRHCLRRNQPNKRESMGILTTSRTKLVRTYQGSFLRDELQKINDACDRFFARRGVASRRLASHRRMNSDPMRRPNSFVS
jgi:hypothetical protein